MDPSDLQGILPWVTTGPPGGDEFLSPEEGLLDRLTGNITCVVNLHASARDATHTAKLVYADLEVRALFTGTQATYNEKGTGKCALFATIHLISVSSCYVV